MRKADRIAGALLLAAGLAFSAGALKHYSYWGDGGPGSAFLPFWLGLALALLALLLFARAWRERNPGENWLPRGEGLRRIGLVVGASAIFIALLKVVGMTVGTAIFLAVLLRCLDRNPWPLTLSVALGTAALNYLVFAHWLRVPFPVGVFGI